jgi:hypothetical protein
MAFNPFHTFRKNSKVVFAGLTILCMVTFILSSGMGRGDVFSQITDWFTGGRRTALITVAGKNFSEQEVAQINAGRRMANDYMDNAVQEAMQGLQSRFHEVVSGLDNESRDSLSLAVNTPALIPFMLQRAEAEKKTDLARALGVLYRLQELTFILSMRQPREGFFGPYDKIEDTADFLVWRHQADRLGIRLTDADISEMIRDETRGELTKDAANRVNQRMRSSYGGGYSVETLYAALGDEFRVRMAQLALTGTAAGVGRHTFTVPPTTPTPDGSWNLFQDARTTVQAGLIAVPVKDFISQVTATPSEEELRRLFEKYKMDEPAPDRDQPGFREPRRIQVAWVGGSAEQPYYQKVADLVLNVGPALRLLGNTSPIMTVLAPVQLDAELLVQYEAFRRQEPPWWDPLSTFIPRLHETSLSQPETVAALVAGTLGASGLGPVPAAVAGPTAMATAALRREVEVRARFGLGMVGFAANPDPLGLFAAPVAALPKITFAHLRPQLREKARKELLGGSPSAVGQAGIVADDLIRFRGEVMRLGREKGRAEVDKYVADFVKERGAPFGQMAEPRDQYHLGDDPALAPLKQAYLRVAGTQDPLLHGFGPYFFANHSQEGPDGLFIPHLYATGLREGPQYYWWRAEDLPPRTPKFEKARPEVVEAWKLMQARPLAEAEAKKLEEKVKGSPREAGNLRDAAVQNGLRDYFELGPMALYMPQPNPTGRMQGTTYESVARPQPMAPERLAQVYHIPPEKVAYPDAAMVTALLNLRKDPKGATTIVADKPKATYYVATLLKREQPTEDEFRRVYQGSMTRAPERDNLLAMLTAGRPEEYRKAVLEQLRAEANVMIHEPARQANK